MSTGTSDCGAILLELTRFGSAVRVVAVDETTGLEVRFTAALNTPMPAIEALAAGKLAYVLARSNRPALAKHA